MRAARKAGYKKGRVSLLQQDGYPDDNDYNHHHKQSSGTDRSVDCIRDLVFISLGSLLLST
jgi:hypothetical protein